MRTTSKNEKTPGSPRDRQVTHDTVESQSANHPQLAQPLGREILAIPRQASAPGFSPRQRPPLTAHVPLTDGFLAATAGGGDWSVRCLIVLNCDVDSHSKAGTRDPAERLATAPGYNKGRIPCWLLREMRSAR